jgi:tRNA pseudouridine55 synthase
MPPRRQKKGEIVNGMLLIDKPAGISSNHALQTVKRLLNAQKAGHTGSLDPIATGLLPVCFGQATKISGFFLNSDKHYDVTIQFGITTDSGDTAGNIIKTSDIEVERSQLEQVLDRFRGQISQVPPMYSALKRNGQPLYKLARKGIEIDREPRPVTVFNLTLTAFKNNNADLSIACSKGFYIRSLAMDIGAALGCGGHVSRLRRTGVSNFSIDQAVTIAQLEVLESAEHRQRLLLPADHALHHLPRVDLTEESSRYFCQGQPVRSLDVQESGMARLYSENNTFLGLGEMSGNGFVAPKRLFV